MNTNKPTKKPRTHRTPAAAQLPRYVDMNDVAAATGLSRRHIYAMVLAGEFPKPIQLGRRRIAFKEQDVLLWLDSRKTPEWAAA